MEGRNNNRLTFETIKEKYPSRFVGASDIIYNPDSNIIDSAIVKYTTDDISYEDLCLKAVEGEVYMYYTTPDEDWQLGGLQTGAWVSE